MTQEKEIVEKSKLIKEIIQVWKVNPRYTEDRISIEKLRLENATLEQVRKQYIVFVGQKKENELNKKMSDSVSIQEIKEYIDSVLDVKIGGESKKLKRQMMTLISEQLPVIKLSINEAPTVDVGIQHKQFKKLLGACMTRSIAGPTNVWLTGPAGSGKTKGAEGVAKALGLEFYFNGAIDTPYKLTGFIDAGGKLHRTAFREAYENGGVYLFDEVDASLPGALLAFNAALANGYADFPDGRVSRHKDCVIIAAANTWGTGPNSDYVGRNKLDAAFIDRFVQISWGYDKQLEKILAGHDSWTEYVQTVRENVMSKGIKCVISPRSSISGAALLKSGMFTISEVVDMTLKKGLSEDNWMQATSGINMNKIDITDGGKYDIDGQPTNDFKKKKM